VASDEMKSKGRSEVKKQLARALSLTCLVTGRW
jgi:hypothetical protein